MKRGFVLLLLLCFGLMGQESKLGDFKSVPRTRTPKKIDMNMPESPLVVNGSKNPMIDLGRVFKLNQRIFRVVVENPSNEDIEYEGIVINCNCTSIINKVPKKGKIPAKGKLSLVVRLNAPELAVEKSFVRMMRFELKKYRAFQIDIAGNVSGDLVAAYYDDPEGKPRTRIAVGYITDPSAPWNTKIHIASLSKKEVIELDKIMPMKNFTAVLKKETDYHWVVELVGKKNMIPGVIRDALAIRLKKPVPEAKGHKDMIFLPIEGVIGMQLKGTASQILIDTMVEKDPVISKSILISRANFMDAAMIRAAFKGKVSPYSFKIDTLTVEETKVTAPEGVKVELKKHEKGVYVTFTMQVSKLTEEGVYAVFEAPGSKALKVRLAILGDEERAELKAEAEAKAREEEEERKAQAEQDAL